MATVSHVQKLMSEVGPLVDRIESIQQGDDDHWVIGIADDLLLTVDFADESRKLVFSVELARPDGEHLQEAYEVLLTANALWRETDGVRLALNGPGGHVVLLYDLFILDLDVGTLATVIENLAGKAETWREVLPKLGRAGPGESSADGGPEGFPDAVRV